MRRKTYLAELERMLEEARALRPLRRVPAHGLGKVIVRGLHGQHLESFEQLGGAQDVPFRLRPGTLILENADDIRVTAKRHKNKRSRSPWLVTEVEVRDPEGLLIGTSDMDPQLEVKVGDIFQIPRGELEIKLVDAAGCCR